MPVEVKEKDDGKPEIAIDSSRFPPIPNALAVPEELLTLEKLKALVMPAKVIVNGFAKLLDEAKMPLAGAGQPPPHCR
ncbi:hypothetical protein GCM10011393_10120 [Sphingopyxis bauzanensis]|nr:hypothetical protein GCM10011393_10120 [Sphingopyxis bauzanensis]